jgi:hypothetical protein
MGFCPPDTARYERLKSTSYVAQHQILMNYEPVIYAEYKLSRLQRQITDF